MKYTHVRLLSDDLYLARCWAVSKFGDSHTHFNKGTWYQNGKVFYFSNEKDAMLFVLKWDAVIE